MGALASTVFALCSQGDHIVAQRQSYGGTLFFLFVFLALTYQNEQVLPERDNRAALTPQAIAGKNLWEVNDCVGCHTLQRIFNGLHDAAEWEQVFTRMGRYAPETMPTRPQLIVQGGALIGESVMLHYIGPFTYQDRPSILVSSAPQIHRVFPGMCRVLDRRSL